jgi:8-oxo-dGTP diphosphatase
MRIVTVAYLAILRDVGTLVAGTDAARAELVPVQDVLAGEPSRTLAFDHRRILEDGIARAREKLASTSLATAFIGPEFTLSDLRSVYEAAWGVQLDPGNFRRKVLSIEGFVEPTGRRVSASPVGGKPAETYTSDGIVPLHPPLQPSSLRWVMQQPRTAARYSDATYTLAGIASPSLARTVWRVRLWDDATLQQAMLDEGVIAIGGDELGDLARRPSDEDLAAKLRDPPLMQVHRQATRQRSQSHKAVGLEESRRVRPQAQHPRATQAHTRWRRNDHRRPKAESIGE